MTYKENKSIVCGFCGLTIEKPKYGSQKYCDKKCMQHAYYEKYRRKPKDFYGYCSYCNKKFIRKTINQKYCSKECGKEASKEKYEESKTKSTFLIFARDNFRCQYCGKTPQDKIKLTIDHIYPVSKGGDENHSNLITACSECNSLKSNNILQLDMLFYFWNVASKKEFTYSESFEKWKEYQGKRHTWTSNNDN